MTPDQFKQAQREVHAEQQAKETARTIRLLLWALGIAVAIAVVVKALDVIGSITRW